MRAMEKDGEEDDEALFDRWSARDNAAGDRLLRRHLPALARFFHHKVEGEIDDLVQETFMGCLRNRETFRRDSSFRTFLFSIARRRLIDYWRSKQRRPQPIDFMEVSLAALSTSAGSRLARHDEHGRLLLALQELSLEQQLLLELYYWEEHGLKELALIFDVDPNTIGSRLFRARDELRRQLNATLEGTSFDAWARALQRKRK